MTKRWMTVVGAVAMVGTLLGGVALADKTPDAKATKEYKKPAPSAGSVAIQKQLEDIYNNHMEQVRKEALAAIDQAVKDGKISEKEAAGYRHKYEAPAAPVTKEQGTKKAPAAPVTREQLKATLDQMVKNGEITQAHADQKLAGFDKAQANNK